MPEYDHVMYFSPSHVNQLFTEEFGPISQLDIETSEEVSKSFEGMLKYLISMGGSVTNSEGETEVQSINFDDKLVQVKHIINELLESEEIPRVSSLYDGNHSDNNLYRFSSPVLLRPKEGKLDDRKFIEVTGIEQKVRFEGNTSLDNWGSRSHLLTAIEADDPYPFRGVLKPIERQKREPERDTYSVQFLFICAPNEGQRARWLNNQQLVRESLKNQQS